MGSTFVLVHGAWAGGWIWHGVTRDLEGRGHRVFAPTMPGMSPGEDPAAVHLSDATDCLVRLVEGTGLDDVTLVAHDWGGYAATSATHKLGGRVTRIIYWSAFVPQPGESLLDTIPDEDTVMLTAGAARHGGDSVLVPPERWTNNFLQTAPHSVRDLTYQLLRPMPWTYFAESLGAEEAAIPAIEISYLVGSDDRALPFGDEWWVDKYAPRAGVAPVVFDGPHAAHLATPSAVAAELDRLVR